MAETPNKFSILPTLPITLVLTAFLFLWAWVHREDIVPQSKSTGVEALLSNVEFVKSSPFPDSPITPIGPAYEAVASMLQWEEFVSPKGTRVVQVSGKIADADLRKKILQETYNVGTACEKVPAVQTFFQRHRLPGPPSHIPFSPEQFHAATASPSEHEEIVRKEGFAEAAKAYVEANVAHFKADITIKSQFPLLVLKKQSRSHGLQSLLGSELPFRVGFSSVTLSGGPYAGEEIKYLELPQQVASN